MRDLFRRYLDSRIKAYEQVPDLTGVMAELEKSSAMQREIWTLAVASSQKAATGAAPMLLLPALNAMFDIVTSRTEAIRLHPPLVIHAMLGALTLACSLFAGYDMAGRPKLNMFHSIAFAAVLSVTVYVIVDLEFPRLGMIRMDDSDQVLVDLRKSMN
jgi:hypothetical protein